MIDGLPAFIPDFKECHEDIIDHIKYEQEMIENHYGLNPPLFIIGHSMGKLSFMYNLVRQFKCLYLLSFSDIS